MLMLFYGVIIILTSIACFFFMPLTGLSRASVFLSLLLFMSSAALYQFWGSPALLKDYYKPNQIMARQEAHNLRARLLRLSKAEYAIRLRLERVPEAPRLLWQLEDLLAQRAMLAGAWKEAYQHCQEALRFLAKDPLEDTLKKDNQQKMKQIIAVLKPVLGLVAE